MKNHPRKKGADAENWRVLSDVVKLLDSECSDETLLLLGMYRMENKAYHLYNKRRVNVLDAEHMACKTYLLTSRTLGTRRYSEPSPSREHTHPTKTATGMHPGELGKIFKKLYSSFVAMAESKMWERFHLSENIQQTAFINYQKNSCEIRTAAGCA